MIYLKKIKREFIAGLSEIYIRYVRSNYLGLKIKVPLIHGMRNGGYIVPSEFWMSDCLASFVETKPGCVIDVGVNVGLYLVKLRVISDDVAYYGIDPNPSCTFYTQELIRLNQFGNAKLLTTALSNSSGVVDFYTQTSADRMGSLIKSHHNYNNHSFSTLTMTGDALIDVLKLDEISAVKIDVEGAESLVLEGMLASIKKYTPYIYIEILDAKNPDSIKICELIQNMRYSLVGRELISGEVKIIESISKTNEKYDCNYVFAPNDYLGAFMGSMKQ